jgi:hypothetical protein
LQWRGALRVADGDVWSGGTLVLVDESAQDVATGNGIAARRDQITDRLGELQATVWSRLVVLADVLVEDGVLSENPIALLGRYFRKPGRSDYLPPNATLRA